MDTEAVKKLRDDLIFSESQSGPGKECAIITTQAAVRGALLEIAELDGLNKKYFTELEQLRRRK